MGAPVTALDFVFCIAFGFYGLILVLVLSRYGHLLRHRDLL